MSKRINSRRILVVDDDSDILSLIGHIYESEGYQVDLATNGQEALDFLRASSELPSLVLLDLMMPFLDGVGFMKQVAEDSELATLSVVVMSASGEREVLKKGIDVHRYIKKPIDLDTLVNVAQQHCQIEGSSAPL
jgi:CheY-like chemotaxis protein